MQENALVSCCLCPHLINTCIFPASINSECRFVFFCALSAGTAQRVGCFQEPSFPGPKATQNLGGQCKERLGNLGTWGSRAARLAHPSPRKKHTGLGAAGHSRPSKSTFLLCCNHNKVCSTSGTHNKTIKLLEIKSKQVSPLHPKSWGAPQEQECNVRARPGFSVLISGLRERRWEEEPTGSPVLPTSSPGGLHEANFD